MITFRRSPVNIGYIMRCFSAIIPVHIPDSLVREFKRRCVALENLPQIPIGYSFGDDVLLNSKSIKNYKHMMQNYVASPQNIKLASAEFKKFIENSSNSECKEMKDEMDRFMTDPNRSIIAFSNLPQGFAYTDFFTRILCDYMGFHPFSFVGIMNGEPRKANETSQIVDREEPLRPHNDYRSHHNLYKPDLVTFACVNLTGIESDRCETFFIEAKKIYNRLLPKHQTILSSPILSYAGSLQNGYAENNTTPGGIFYFDQAGVRRICYDNEIYDAIFRGEDVINTKEFSKEEIMLAVGELHEVVISLSKDRDRHQHINLLPGWGLFFWNYSGLHGRNDRVLGRYANRTLIHHLHSRLEKNPDQTLPPSPQPPSKLEEDPDQTLPPSLPSPQINPEKTEKVTSSDTLHTSTTGDKVKS